MTAIFEQLVLAPRLPKEELPPNAESITQCIYRRVRWFRAGRFQDLYNESRQVKSKSPSAQRSSSSNNDKYIEKSAQLAADVDNYGTCNYRLTKNTPVAVVDDSNISILQKLHPNEVYPPSVPRLRSSRRRKNTKQRHKNCKQFIISPDVIVNNILHLKKGKATGLQVDSIDLFIILAQRCRHNNSKKKTLKSFSSTLAEFFTLVANGKIPKSLISIYRTTYLVALEKDPDDNTKLRPLGIPSAVRRITANTIANETKAQFADHLLPYNYAVGIKGGIDFITSTVRLAVEKYITNQTELGLLPTRALVSLDIRNMFNAISRHKLREIVREEFPRLTAFVDCLYEEQGKSIVKMDDGEWEEIPVCEGFSQGCPLSPILAAIVLNHILKHVDSVLTRRASTRSKSQSDDGTGGLAIIMAYVDDANFLVPLEDVKPLLEAFKEVAEPLGAKMNEEKTRILTSTSGKSILDQLKSDNPSVHDSLKSAIETYSINKDGSMHEETNGLRVLGVPIGNDDYCQSFILNKLQEALSDSKKILNGLSDKQTKLRVFKTCTLHKITHLFASDVASTPSSLLPKDWNIWCSQMSMKFSTLVNNFLQELTGVTSIPAHSHIISTLALSCGGLGLQHPRLNSIPTFMLTTKRAITYSQRGIFLPFTPSAIKLPPSITSLYSEWDGDTTLCRTFQAFQQYLPDITAAVTRDDPSKVDSLKDQDYERFIHKTSIPWARDILRHHSSCLYLDHLEDNAPDNVYHAIPGLLNKQSSLPLVAMPRSNIKNRMSNKEFDIALKSKLRLPIYPEASRPLCYCGELVDVDGDHYFKCGEWKKNRCSNMMRDTTARVMRRICPTAKYCTSADNIHTEDKNKVKDVPYKRPFDWSFEINHIKSTELSRSTPLTEVGFDVTVISPSTPDDLQENACPYNNSISLLEEGERKKFERNGADSDKSTGVTLTGDQFMGKLLDTNRGFIPQSMDRWGNLGPLSRSAIIGDELPPKPLVYDDDKPNARKMNELACSRRVPFGIIKSANKCWMNSNPNTWYGDSYMDQNPQSWALQQLGLGFTLAIVKHIIAADNKIQDITTKSIYKRRQHRQRASVIPSDPSDQSTYWRKRVIPVTPVDTSEDSQLTNNRVEPVNDAIGISNDESITNSPPLSETNNQDTERDLSALACDVE